MAEVNERRISPFNGSVESGLRSLVLLEAAAPGKCDVGRLVVYDYLLVHSADAENGPDSLHPATPYRSGELLVRRELIRSGLRLMISRELLAVEYGSDGVVYSATELTRPFLEHLHSEYASQLRARASWVVAAFAAYTDEQIGRFAMSHLNDWGGELVNQASPLSKV